VTNHTPDTLRAFTNRVKDAFLAKRIAAPVHLCGGNEEQVIEAFRHISQGDWVFSTWRSAYHALLHGIPEDWVFGEILAGRSMYLMNKEHRFMASSIVGGMLPVACGVAAGIKRRPVDYLREARDGGMYGLPSPGEYVNVFIGDMAWRTGIYHEFQQYCIGHNLPVRVFVEDNGLSTNTPTIEAWGLNPGNDDHILFKFHRYEYQRTWPHVGVGQNVQF
jgi:pyruvate dehydrogenase E1 component alpha subunit